MALTKIPASLLDTASGLDLQGNITLGDSEKILLGDSSDLQIYHDESGGHSRIDDTGTGGLVIRGSQVLLEKYGGGYMINAVADGASELYHAGFKKFETTSTGATVTGNLAVTGDLDITGNVNSYNVTDLDVTDQTITLGAGQTEANSGGSGIIVDGSNASILWDETNTSWDLNKPLTLENAATADMIIAETTDDNTRSFITTKSKDNNSNSVQLKVGTLGDGPYGMLFTYTNHPLTFATNNSAPQMTLDTSGRLGIGYNLPADNIHILGSSGTPNVGIRLQSHDTANATATLSLLARDASNVNQTVNIQNNKGDLYIDSNVGIGTTPSTTIRNDISSAEKALQIGNRAMIFSDSGVTTDLQNNSHLNNSDTRVAMQTDAGSLYQQHQGIHRWFNAASVSAGADQTMIQRMIIDLTGKVGIGTNNPSHGLTVSDDTVGGDADMRRITIKSATHGVNSGFRFDSESTNGTARAGGYYFQPGDTDATTYLGLTATDAAYQMVINREGNVGIGTDSPNISSGSSASTILTVGASGSNANGLLELVGTRANSGDVVSYIRTFNNSATTPITDIRSVHQGSDTTGSLEFYTTNAGTSNKALEISQDGFLSIHRNASEYGVSISSAGTRSGLVIKKPGTTSNKGSLLVLSDESYRLGTGNYYHSEMLQNGFTRQKTPDGTYFTVTKYFNAIGSTTTKSYIDLVTTLGASTTGYLMFEVRITGYASGGLNGVNSGYRVCGYSGHSYSATNYNSLGAGTIQNGYNSSTGTVHNATGLSYHPCVNLGSNISNGQVWTYVPGIMQYGFTVVNGSSQAMGCMIVITGFYS